MKEHTTKLLKGISYLYLGFPVTYALYATILFDLPKEILSTAFVTWSYLFLSISGIITGYGLKEVTRWCWTMFLITSVGVAIANAILAIKYGATHHTAYAYLLSIGLLFALGYLVSREIRVPYFLPKLRWWETKPRYRLNAKATGIHAGTTVEGMILDLSVGGCFLKTKYKFSMGDRFVVKFPLFGAEFQMPGVVVWMTEATVTRPQGVGLMFKELTKADKELLKRACFLLGQYQGLEQKRDKLSETEYAKKLEELKARSVFGTHSAADSVASS